jgi:subtilase family serine protease
VEQQTPGSANYHHWLTPEEYGQRVGVSDADSSKVIQWL